MECEVDIGGGATGHAQRYRLRLSLDATQVEADDDANRSYAEQTLIQLRRQVDRDGTVPCGVIKIWPGLAERGVMLDISRNKVPTMASLFAFVDRLAHFKVNRLQHYMEHSFAYLGHEAVWRDASPTMPDQVRELDAYSRARHVELVPNQNYIGHLERWFRRDDATGRLAEGVLEMGRVERETKPIAATNPLTLALMMSDRPLVDGSIDQGFRRIGPFTVEMLVAAKERMDRAVALVDASEPGCADAAYLAPELRNAVALTRHAAEQLRVRLEAGVPRVADLPRAERRRLADELAPLIEGFRRRWLARRLADCVAPLEATLAAYA